MRQNFRQILSCFYDSEPCLLQEGLYDVFHPSRSHPSPDISLNASSLSGTPSQPRNPGPSLLGFPLVLGLVGGLGQRCRQAAAAPGLVSPPVPAGSENSHFQGFWSQAPAPGPLPALYSFSFRPGQRQDQCEFQPLQPWVF